MEIHSDNVNMVNEWAAVLLCTVQSSSFEWMKKTDPEDWTRLGIAADLWIWGKELFSQTQMYTVLPYLQQDLNDKWLMLERIYEVWINKPWYKHLVNKNNFCPFEIGCYIFYKCLISDIKLRIILACVYICFYVCLCACTCIYEH